MTRQSDLDASDINVMMKRYEKTGVLPVGSLDAVFADVSTIGCYQEALERIRVAEGAFLELSPGIRERFANDPVLFLDFASRPENRAELGSLGVLPEAEAPKVVAPAPPAA